jgi:hypothetical protein
MTTMTRRTAWFLVVPGLALLSACGGGGAAATLKTRATQAAVAVPRVVSSAETSRYLVDPPAPTDHTAFTEADIRNQLFDPVSPGATIHTIALARLTDEISLMPVEGGPPSSAPPDVGPQTWRIDHVPAIVVVANGPFMPASAGANLTQAPVKNESIVAAFDPVTGQLIALNAGPDTGTNSALESLAVATP